MKVINTGIVEMMMFSINPAFDMLPHAEYSMDQLENGFNPELLHGIDPKRAELYKLCTQKQIGITAMKTLGVAKLILPEHTPFMEPLTITQCIHYALSRPAVASALLGCETKEHVQDAVNYLAATGEQRDYVRIISAMRNDFRGNCVYCHHCQPCPKKIDIAAVNKDLDVAHLDTANIPPSIRSHYLSLPQRGKDCIACGKCEKRCPFGVSVAENMAKAEKLLG
jgi:predicted aldo/keto reductase-like oxidoreductase